MRDDAAGVLGPSLSPGADYLDFWVINNAGLVTGQAANADYSVATGFTVPGATYTLLRGISADARYLTGTYDGFYGFVFDRDTNSLVTVGESMIVQGINSDGVAAGSVIGSGRTPFPYDINTNDRTDYGPERDAYRDVNDSGIVTGSGLRDGFDDYIGIVGAPGSTSVLNVAGSQGTFGRGINNAGTAVGLYYLEDLTNQAFIATSVPEPGAWALMLGGLLALAAWRRRERG